MQLNGITHERIEHHSQFSAATNDGHTLRLELRDHGRADLVLVDDLGEQDDRRIPMLADDLATVRALLDAGLASTAWPASKARQAASMAWRGASPSARAA